MTHSNVGKRFDTAQHFFQTVALRNLQKILGSGIKLELKINSLSIEIATKFFLRKSELRYTEPVHLNHHHSTLLSLGRPVRGRYSITFISQRLLSILGAIMACPYSEIYVNNTAFRVSILVFLRIFSFRILSHGETRSVALSIAITIN